MLYLTTMKQLVIFLIAFTYVYAFPTRIVNGTDAEEGEFPYVISLRDDWGHLCGGSILDEYHILTAAHCVSPWGTYSIQYGVIDISNDDYNSIAVETVTVHENHNLFVYGANDVALLKLKAPIPLSDSVQPVTLPEQGEAPVANSKSVLCGWGYTGYEYPTRLQKVELIVYSDEDCSAAHGSDVSSLYHVCSGVPEGWKGQCSGDSGGPLRSNGKQIGIVSWSIKPCAVVGYPGVYTRVSSYVDWIHEKMSL